jgi:hypothetical protein
VAWGNVTSDGLAMDLGGSGSAFAQLWYDGVEQVRSEVLIHAEYRLTPTVALVLL